MLVFKNITSTCSATQYRCYWSTQFCKEKKIHHKKLGRKGNGVPFPSKSSFEKITKIKKFCIMSKSKLVLKLFTYLSKLNLSTCALTPSFSWLQLWFNLFEKHGVWQTLELPYWTLAMHIVTIMCKEGQVE